MPTAATTKPTTSGPRLAFTAWLRTSRTAAISISRKAVPTIWSTRGPHTPPWKYAAGNVAKMEKVAFVWPFTFGPGAALS